MKNARGPRSERAAARTRRDRAVRRLLEAAAARPEELPQLPPFFAARVRAAASRASQPAHPLAAVALRALPALALLLTALSAWAAFETVHAADTQDDAAMVVLASRDSATDAPLATMLLSGGDSRPSGGAR